MLINFIMNLDSNNNEQLTKKQLNNFNKMEIDKT